MLVYCNEVFLNPTDGLPSILMCVARWLGEKSKTHVDYRQLCQSTRFRLPDNSTVECVTDKLDASDETLPMLICIRLTHGDEIPGRQWVTEIGIECQRAGSPFRCTIVLQTNEISARVNAPITVTRPRIVASLIDKCTPVPSTPGVGSKALTENTSELFAELIENGDRTHPLVVVSATADGQYLIDVKQLQSAVCGLAQVFVIPTDEDTYAICDVVGSKYSPWRGAVKIIYPARSHSRTKFYEVQTLYPEALVAAASNGIRPDREVLSLITHRTNLPLSWDALSFAKVSQAKLQAEFKASQRTTNSAGGVKSDELLNLAFAEIAEKDGFIKNLQSELLDQANELRSLEFEVDSLKHALTKKAESASDSQESQLTPAAWDALKRLRFKDVTVEQLLLLVKELFPDRLVILDSAANGAKKSNTFNFPGKVYELMFSLATDYWTCLSQGTGNHQAKSVFGNSFAARESKTLSNEGKARRTFKYKGKNTEMMQHLKIGTADNPADTLRIHFHWDAADQIIVIGYCGPHLDF